MTFKVSISTSKSKLEKTTEKNWEPGTRNDWKKAVNGWTSIEHGTTELDWCLRQLFGCAPDWGTYDTPAYKSWAEQAKYTISYTDVLCEMVRTEKVQLPGFKQGYINIPAIIAEVEKTGRVEIPFSKAYDTRQNSKCFAGCVVIIERIGSNPAPVPMPVYITDGQREALPKVNFQMMTDGQKNADGKYIPYWDGLIAHASCQEELDYIRRIRWEMEHGRGFGGFAFNLVYITKQTCGHWEIFQHPCNEHYPLATVLNQAIEHAAENRCTSCVCNFTH